MKTILLFDAETQLYRQSLYSYFQKEFEKHGYALKVIYDNKLNNIPNDGLFKGIHYSFRNFNKAIKEHETDLIILFVWLRYRFLLPFMIFNRLKGIKLISWSHGINLQKRNQWLMNQFYYLRQRLANGLIIFSENEKIHIKASHKKLFVANNTLNFYDFPKIDASKEQLKEKYGAFGKKVVLCVGRMNTNNRKPEYLINGFTENPPNNTLLFMVGPGFSQEQKKKMENSVNIRYMGAIYDSITINEIYQMGDIFCMPGAIGLAINQAFYYGLPVVMEDVYHGPEGIYLKEGENGFIFKQGDIKDMMNKINILLQNEELYKRFSNHAKETIRNEASVEKMLKGFLEAIRYVDQP